jgi:hypothetical protein
VVVQIIAAFVVMVTISLGVAFLSEGWCVALNLT